MFAALLPQSVLDAYDLIGFDPRFVGASTPVSCGLTEAERDQVVLPLEQPGGFPATAAFMREVADRCAGQAGDVLRFATTANTARDMERIRQALGEEKISYLGYSYGTYLGAVYAALFPGRMDRFVLDSSVGNKWIWRQQARSQGPGGELRFPDFANFAAANDATYHLGDTPSEIRTLFFELLDRLEENPVTLPDGTVVKGPWFRALTFRGLYFDSDFPDLALIWQFVNESGGKAAASPGMLAAVEALTPAAAAVEVPEDNNTASGLAILCDDVAWPRSVPKYRQDFLSDSRRYPMFGALGSNIWPCAFWHHKPVERLVMITSNGPRNILIVQNLRDPATPLEGALQMRKALGQRARFVSVNQGGHTVYLLNPNACADEIVTAYLAEGTFPGGDLSCPADPPSAAAHSVDALRAQAIQELARRVRGVIP
jgi:pimeloyl-ACP methyl ester carboxylesterase